MDLSRPPSSAARRFYNFSADHFLRSVGRPTVSSPGIDLSPEIDREWPLDCGCGPKLPHQACSHDLPFRREPVAPLHYNRPITTG
jgi:hypothetical protein